MKKKCIGKRVGSLLLAVFLGFSGNMGSIQTSRVYATEVSYEDSMFTEYAPSLESYVNEESGFSHPGVGLTAEMLNTVQEMVRANKEPWSSYFNEMLVAEAANREISIAMDSPETTMYNSQGTNSKFIKDALTAYTQAILYYVTGDNVYRKNCMNVIRAYERLLKENYAYFNDACIHTGIPMNRFCMAADIMRCSTFEATEGFSVEELEWTDEDTEKVIENFIRPSVNTFMSSQDEFMNQHLYTTIGAMSAYIFMDDAEGYAKTVEWFTVNENGANPGFNGSIKRLFREITTVDEIGMKEGQGQPLDTPVIQHIEMGRDQAHGCGDLTNAAILARLTNGQGTKVDPVSGRVSFAEDAVDCYEFLDNRIFKASDFFFKYMLGYDSQWVQAPFSMKADGTIIDNYTEFASGYRGRYSTINFWDFYTYLRYTKGYSDEEIAGLYPYFWEGFMKKMPSNFMWNGNLNINWNNVDGGGDFWLFLPREAEDNSSYIPKSQKDYVVEVEDRGTLVENTEFMSVGSDGESGYISFYKSDAPSKVAITSGGSDFTTFAFKVRTDGIATLSLENGLDGSFELPNTNGQWKYVTYSLKNGETFGDLYYLVVSDIKGSYVDIDAIDIKATEVNGSRTINIVNFNNAEDLDLVVLKDAAASVSVKAENCFGGNVSYSLQDAPASLSVDENGNMSFGQVEAGHYDFVVIAEIADTVATKKVSLDVASTRKDAVALACAGFVSDEKYIAETKAEYDLAKEKVETLASSGSDEEFANALSELCQATKDLKPVSPKLLKDAYTDGETLDLTNMVASTTVGDIRSLLDSDPSFCSRIDGKFNYHIIDFGEDYKVTATKFGLKARLGFADRVAGVQIFGSNDGANWDTLTANEAAYTMAFQTVDVRPEAVSKQYRYLKIQKTTEYPESLRGAYSYMLEFSELRIWGERIEIGNDISSISMTSDSAVGGRIKMGDSVKLTITTKVPVASVSVELQDQLYEATKLSDNSWVVEAVMASGTKPGKLQVAVDYTKQDGSKGATMYGTTDGSSLQLLNTDIYIDTALLAKHLTATSISWDKKSNAMQCAGYLFDKNTSTFGDLSNANGDFYVIDYGEDVSVSVKGIMLMPRSTAANHASRLNGTVVYGTNDELSFEADGSYKEASNPNVKWTAITPAVAGAEMNNWVEFGEGSIKTTEGFRYFKIAGANQGDIAEVEIYGDYNCSVEKIADAINEIPIQEPIYESLLYPQLPSGFVLSVAESDNESIIDLNGKITVPQEDTLVNVVLCVTRLSDKKTCNTKTIPVLVKGIKALLKETKLPQGATEFVFPSVPEGYRVSIETSSNRSIISLKGAVSPKEGNRVVEVSLKVTRESDGIFAVGEKYNVLVYGVNESEKLATKELAIISCSDGSAACDSVFDDNINTFADVSSNAYHTADFGESVVVIDKIRIYPRSDSNDNNAKRTEGAVLLGSNDGESWEAITEPVSAITKGKWKEITADAFKTVGEYRYYKIGGNTRGSMAEVEFYGSIYNREQLRLLDEKDNELADSVIDEEEEPSNEAPESVPTTPIVQPAKPNTGAIVNAIVTTVVQTVTVIVKEVVSIIGKIFKLFK